MIDTPEKLAIHILGKGWYDHSPCQAHPYELIAAEIERLREALKLVPDLIEVARMPNIEHVADRHNKAVKALRAALKKENQNEPT